MTTAPGRTLLLINLLALAGLAYLWVDPQGKLRNSTWVAPAPIKPVLSQTALLLPASPDPAIYNATLERPLFAPDRKPPPPVLPPPPPPPPDPLADAQLLGLVSGETGGVLVRAEGLVRRVNLNKTLGEWTLKSVEDRSATFTRNAETRTIQMAYARWGTPVAAATPAPGAGAGAGPAGPVTEAAKRQVIEDQITARNLIEIRARMFKK